MFLVDDNDRLVEDFFGAFRNTSIFVILNNPSVYLLRRILIHFTVKLLGIHLA